MKIQLATDSIIETYNSPYGSLTHQCRVTKEPAPEGGYAIALMIGCANFLGCNTDPLEEGLDFNRYVGSVLLKSAGHKTTDSPASPANSAPPANTPAATAVAAPETLAAPTETPLPSPAYSPPQPKVRAGSNPTALAATPRNTAPAPKAAANPVATNTAVNTWEKEPDSFLGIKFNEPLDVATCPIKYIGYTEYIDYDAMWSLPRVCIDPLDSSYRHGKPANGTLKIMNVPKIGIGYDVNVKLKNSVVVGFTIKLKQHGYLLLLSAFQERYGEPTSVENSTVKNNAGGEFSSLNVTWKGKKITISTHERYVMVDESYVTISDNAAEEEESAIDRAKRASEAQKF